MDIEKLKALRAKYTGDVRAETTMAPFKAVVDVLFKGDGTRVKPWEGIPTLLDLPHQASLDGLDIAVIGVPMDLGVTNRTGARFGPRALRGIERVGPYNHTLQIMPTAMAKVADVGDVAFRSRYSLENSIEDIEVYFRGVVAAGVRPLSVGGDHSITYPILKAVGEAQPVGLVHIDAHCDTGGDFDGEKFHHGGPFRQAVLAGVLDPERTVQIGIRGASEFIWQFSYDAGMTVIHAEEFEALGVEAVIEKTRKVVGGGPVYVSLDVDGIDPAYCPGTGTPEVGGLTPRETQRLLRGLQGLNVVGGDVVEVAPQYDATTNTVQTGAQMLFEILCLMVMSEHDNREMSQ